MKTLENEFAETVAIHKGTVVKATMMKFYKDLLDTNTLSNDVIAEMLANKELKEILLKNDSKLFNHLYKISWEAVKEYLP